MPAIHPTSRKRSSRELGCADMHSPGPFAALGTEGWARRPGWLRWAIVLFESGHRLLQGLLQGHVPVDLATHVPVLEPRCPEHAVDPVGLPELAPALRLIRLVQPDPQLSQRAEDALIRPRQFAYPMYYVVLLPSKQLLPVVIRRVDQRVELVPQIARLRRELRFLRLDQLDQFQPVH